MVTVVRVARVLLILALAFLTISLVMGIGTPTTGLVEKLVLLLLIGACVYAAAKISALTERAVQRTARR
jgi:hypothetical protein